MANVVFKVITDAIISRLKTGVVPWHCPWNRVHGLPQNFVTRKPYRGLNVLLTVSAGYSSPYWMTYRQISAIGGTVRKGEHATPIIYWGRSGSSPTSNSAANSEGLGDSVFDSEPTAARGPRLFQRYYNVFNVDQCDGLPIVAQAKPPLEPGISPARHLVTDYLAARGPRLEHGGGRAFYSPGRDEIWMPLLEAFENEEEYHCTLFHELVHSTGHSTRLDRRDLAAVTKVEKLHAYSREELTAEMGAAFLCGLAGIEMNTLDNSASYINGWLKQLGSDPAFVLRAASQAQKAVGAIVGEPNDASGVLSAEVA